MHELPAVALTSGRLDAVVDALLADPWLDPAAAAGPMPAGRSLELVRRVGAFRGFGGLFMAPPMVSCPDGQLLVSDSGSHWLLFADRFGATFQRAEAPAVRPANKSGKPSFKVGLDGKVSRGREQAVFPEVERSQSSAANDTTLAVTTPLSHSIFLFALINA